VIFERNDSLRSLRVDDGKVFRAQIVDVTAAAVGDGSIDLDESAAGAKKGIGGNGGQRGH